MKPRYGQEGLALVYVLLCVIVLFGAVTVVVSNVHSSKRSTDAAVSSVVLDEACQSAIDLGIQRVWNAYLTGNGNTTGNLASYRVFINGIVANNEDTNHDGTQNAGETDLDGNSAFDMAGPAALITPANPYALDRNGATITSLLLTRTDDLTGVNLTLVASASVQGQSQTVTQTVRVAGEKFTGFEYAVLANNINCIMCHAEFRALDLERNLGNPGTYGTFDRIKIATLESLLIRPSSCDSNVAGTAYTRGVVTNESGTPLSASQITSSQMNGYEFSTEDGKIVQSSSGGLNEVSLKAGTVDGNGDLKQFANLYQQYPTDEDAMTDGPLPSSFPAPFGDDNGNRYVDDAEFQRVMNSASGTITGGVAFGVPEGEAYSGNALPSSSNSALSDLSTTGTYDGNLILVGTDQNPIQLNGNVAVNGDLVIDGKVKGWGQFFVRGNSYVVGDVTYADAPGEFGQASDGTENGLALVSGGSVLMGDYLTIRGKSHTDDTSKYPNSSYSIRFRDEHKSSNVKINRVTQKLEYGYFDPGVVDAGMIDPTMVDSNGNLVTRTGQQFSFTTSELMLFNDLEVQKVMEDPTYTPRFYGLRDTQPNAIYTYEHPPDEHSVRYDESGNGVKPLTDYLIMKGVSLDVLDRAAFHYMNPSGDWISEDTLRQIWWNDEMTRPSTGRRFQFDGLIYSNNAIFGIVHSRVRHGSYTDGKMAVRGAIVCPDLGILSAGTDGSGNQSFQLFYDRRVKRFWSLEDPTQVEFRRLAYTRGTPEGL